MIFLEFLKLLGVTKAHICAAKFVFEYVYDILPV